MLPSTGYFNGINCPFYDSGLCERPYCHFRHVKKDQQNTDREGIDSGEILQKLVSAAVQKVLQQTDSAVAQTPLLKNTPDSDINNAIQSTSKVTYNPTPISELNKISNTDIDTTEESEQRKKHIPVPYTPRKPATATIRKFPETNGSFKPYIYIPPPLKYTPGSAENVQCDIYTPPGSTKSKEKYLPGTEKPLQEYTPDDNAQNRTNVRNYIPSDKNSNKSKVLEYQPKKVTTKNEVTSVTYQPTPRSLAPCFSSDEEEPDCKRKKVSTDLHGLDDLEPEFDILDQILDEETKSADTKLKLRKDKKDRHADNPFKNTSMTNSETEKSNININETPETSSKGISSARASLESNSKNLNVDNKHKISESLQKDKLCTNSKEVGSNGDDINKDKIKQTKNENSQNDKLSTRSKENNTNYEDINKDNANQSKTGSKTSHKDLHKKDRSESVDNESELSNKKLKHKSSRKDRDKEKRSDKHKHKKKDKHIDSDRHSSSKKANKDSYHSKTSSSSKSAKNSKTHHRKSHNSLKSSKEKYKDKVINNDLLDDVEEIDDQDNIPSESDEEAIALQCKKIFEEYVPAEKVNIIYDTDEKEAINQDEEHIPGKKRVSRTNDKNMKSIQRLPMKPSIKINAAQTMAERLAKVREFHNSKNSLLVANNNNTNKIEIPRNNSSAPNTGNTKIRIAHVPYASTLMDAKKHISNSQSIKPDTTNCPSTSTTITQTVKKGEQRVAHIPNEKFIDRPGVLEPLASKISANIRSTYLNMMIDECLKLYITATDAYARAQHEELATSKKCSTVQIYKNSAVMTISRLRKELLECNGVKKLSFVQANSQKNSDISVQATSMGSWSIESKNRKSIDYSKELSGAKFYNNIYKWILSEEELKSNGYPRLSESGEKGRATIFYVQNKQKPPKGLIRTCSRCKKDYTVTKKGFPALKEECIYHPNNKYRVRGEARYQCCSQDATSDGCCVASSHVYEYLDLENLRGFVKTLPPSSVLDDYGVFSLDCEMCYTTHGLDLTRVTVINSSCKVVYETLIKPLHPIIDYNTRFSGITEELMAEVKTSLLEVQATLLAMFNSKTILIGHSLESDFKALKLIHDTVIDTSVLFPHKMGPPYKRALKNLSSEYLKKIIQNSVEGHNSAEDALVCMELIHYKLKEELKIR